MTFECKLSYVIKYNILLNDVTQPGVGFIHVCDQGAASLKITANHHLNHIIISMTFGVIVIAINCYQ